jgi:hypothetical protein
MSQYLQELCASLCKVLDYSASLEAPRFGGYAANPDFWTSEVAHRLALIDGYAAFLTQDDYFRLEDQLGVR